MIPSELNINNIEKIYKILKQYINLTPLYESNENIKNLFNTNLFIKYEFLQKSGSFKVRGAINNIISIEKNKLKNGITAVSAGNHAIAASYVSNLFNLKNKIYLYDTANNYRIDLCKNLNANIFFTNAINAFNDVKKAEEEGYKFIHPFDGPLTLQGSATLGLEIYNQFNKFNKKIDNVIISVGGGGLISGVGSFIKQINPKVKIFGVEPEGAKGMLESIIHGKPLNKVNVSSVADSLCAPLHLPYSFAVANKIIDKIYTVTDQQMIEFMYFAFDNFKLALEPACVAGLAALKYHLKDKLENQNTVLILCGSNIDYFSWKKLVFNNN